MSGLTGEMTASRVSVGSGWSRELLFLLRDRTVVVAIAMLALMSVVATSVGLLRVDAQASDIAQMIKADAADRALSQAPIGDYGDAGYYSFYVTYDPPAPLAFAAMGQRDTAPYLKRIRLLALEGQIYQGESPNPLLAQIGSLDLSFIAAYLLPLIIIVLLYDLIASESAAGRLVYLQSMPNAWRTLWLPRIAWRGGLAFAAITLPFVVGAVAAGAASTDMLAGFFGLFAVTLFWTLLVSVVATRDLSAASIAAALIALWLMLNVLLPAAVQNLVVPTVEGPAGADISLVQREAVNDAWDLPKSATMEPFTRLFPQFEVKEQLKPFDWRWYFAFQHMGDVAASELSQAYRDAIRERDHIAALTAWVSPALAIQRYLQRLARTDIAAQLEYDAAIRRYHAELQRFFLPLIFGNREYDGKVLQKAPAFSASGASLNDEEN